MNSGLTIEYTNLNNYQINLDNSQFQQAILILNFK